jgi:hypothetical protein
VHPLFTNPNAYFDVAIVETDKDVALSPLVQPICLPEASTDVDKYEDKTMHLTG